MKKPLQSIDLTARELTVLSLVTVAGLALAIALMLGPAADIAP